VSSLVYAYAFGTDTLHKFVHLYAVSNLEKTQKFFLYISIPQLNPVHYFCFSDVYKFKRFNILLVVIVSS